MNSRHFEPMELPSNGLSAEEAASRLKNEGFNELPSHQPGTIWKLLRDVLKEPMFLLLIAAATVYLILGDKTEAITLFISMTGIIGITLYQERKVERVLGALRNLTSPRALVVRDGIPIRIAGREVVRGDLSIIVAGDRVPADATLLPNGTVLMVDESMLTGESIPVRKMAAGKTESLDSEETEECSHIYSGSLVVQGRGYAVITATGSATKLGRIGNELKNERNGRTSLELETGRLVRQIAFIGMIACLGVALLYGFTYGNWLKGVLAGLTLAMAVLPEEFPVVLTLFLALGAWRISKKRVLTRRSAAIEALGSATILCVDKTGTLTQNRMEVRSIYAGGKTIYKIGDDTQSIPEEFHPPLEFAILASDLDPFDPMEIAFRDFGNHYLGDSEHIHSDWTLVREYPLEPELLAMSQVWKGGEPGTHLVATKGAPEAIADLCHLSEHQRIVLESQTKAMAAEGLRVLGVAKTEFRGEPWPRLQHDFEFKFVGLIGLADPLRANVPIAIEECHSAGIRVVMMTGDFSLTASVIAIQAGLKPPFHICTGQDLRSLNDAQLADRAIKTNIFSRVDPEQKLRLVKALKSQGEVVAMTGDGVNDAPALKGADIGIAMGKRGTDVAREAASLVLLDDDFSSIVEAIREGRRIFDNLRNAMSYLLVVHFPIVGISLIPLILGWPMMFTPVHIVFMEFIIDPACSIVFESEKADPRIMKRPPRSSEEPILRKKEFFLLSVQGGVVLLVTMALYGYSLGAGMDEGHARALAFSALIISNLTQIFVNRSRMPTLRESLLRPNTALWSVVGATLLLLVLVLYNPSLRKLFQFSRLDLMELTGAVLAGFGSVIWFELYKIVDLKFKPH